MSKTLFQHTVTDMETGEIKYQAKTIKKELSSEMFMRTYFKDIGRLRKCTKGEIDFITCVMELGYIQFDTNEIVINPVRRQEIAKCGGFRQSSIYSFTASMKSKKIIVVDRDGKMYLNPELFFYGSDIAREQCLSLTIKYVLTDNRKEAECRA